MTKLTAVDVYNRIANVRIRYADKIKKLGKNHSDQKILDDIASLHEMLCDELAAIRKELSSDDR